ncbi:MAG: glycosyltransferase family 4 protein [Bacteroidota bacterium]
MNILYLCDEYPPGQHGGIGTSVQLLARQMAKMGHRVVVAGLYSPGYGGADEFTDKGVQVYRYRWEQFDGKLFQNQQSLMLRIINRLLKDTGAMDRVIKNSLKLYKAQLEEIIIKHQIDIIEMPDYNDYIRHCRSYIPFPKLSVPVVVKMNGSITYFNREAGKQVPGYILKMERAILNQAVAVASVSNYTAVKSAGYFSYPNKMEILHNGIDANINIQRVEKKPLQVIFTGTLVQKKGIYQLAKAWNIVNKQLPDARLLVFGKGNWQKVLGLLSDGAKGTVTYMGHVTRDELYQHLAASSIAVFPSYAEAFALAPLEAMACGTSVINSNRTSGPELIEDQVDGLLIDPDDINQFASAVLHLLSKSEISAVIAKRGNEKVRKLFDISYIASQNIGFYTRVLGTGHA